jgi:hypothetical protein
MPAENQIQELEFGRQYWFAHWNVLLIAGLIGSSAVFLLVWMIAHGHGYYVWPVLVFPLLFSPFRLSNRIGRLWWSSYLVAVASGAAAVLLGFHNPVSWLCAALAGCAYAVGVCLRWHPGTE